MRPATSKLAHAGNSRSQYLSGRLEEDDLNALAIVKLGGGIHGTGNPGNLEVVDNAPQPVASQRNFEPVLFGLEHAGYVAKGPSGWIATSKGCALVEEQRSWSQEPPSPIERFQQ